jgi:hypothetical protein
MTQRLEIIDDVVSGDVGSGEEVDLVNGSLKLRGEGWVAVSSTTADRVWETIELVGVDDDADLVLLANKLDRLLQLARDYDRIKSVNREILLIWQASGEADKVARVNGRPRSIKGWYNPPQRRIPDAGDQHGRGAAPATRYVGDIENCRGREMAGRYRL